MEDQCKPLTVDMVCFQTTLCHALTPHLQEQSMHDWFTNGMYGGFCLSKWVQEEYVLSCDQVKLAINGKPMAFLIYDLAFKGENGRHMTRAEALWRPCLPCQTSHSPLAVPEKWH
jgi:hypothetical protein